MNYRGLGSGIVRALQDGADIEFVNNEDANTFKAILRRKDLSTEESGKKSDKKTDEGGQITAESGMKTDNGGKKSGKKTDEGGQKTAESSKKTDNGGKKSGKETAGNGKKNIDIILELIAQNPMITHKELSERIGIVPSAIQKHIENLKAKGVIKRVGPDKGGRWEIIQSND